MKKSNPQEASKSNRDWVLPQAARFLAEALDLARQAAAEDEVPVGAVVVGPSLADSGAEDVLVVLGRGYNRRERDNNPCSHAEIEAILEATRARGDWRLEDCALYVTLEPCPMCLGACQQARVGQVVYGAADPKGGALSLGYKLNEDPRLNHRFAVHLAETPACGQVLREFFARKRKPIA